MLRINNLDSVEELAKRLERYSNFGQLSFYTGKLLEKTAEICRGLCPYSKLAVLYTQSCFDLLGKELTDLFYGNGLTPVNLVLSSEEFKLSQAELAKSLPENVRIIVTVDSEHILNAQELANRVGVICALGFSQMPSRLINEQCPFQTAFVLSEDMNICNYQLYQNTVCKIVSLLDIKIKQFFKKTQQNFELIDEFIEILDFALDINTEKSHSPSQELIESQIKLELIEKAFSHYSLFFDVKTSLCIIKLVADSLNREFFRPPSYLEQARPTSELFGVNYLQVLENIKAQLVDLEEHKDCLAHIKRGISALARVYSEKTRQIISTFKALDGRCERGGQKLKTSLELIKHGGNIHYYNNSLSLIRETGLGI